MIDKSGFTLVEIITVIVLLGIIGLFSSMFLNSGVKTFLFSRTNSQTALNASIALNRIGLELKDIKNVSIQPNVSIAYKNNSPSLPGSRTLTFGSGDKIILTVDGNAYTLLDNISSPTLTGTYDDLDYDGISDNISGIEIGFNVDINGISKRFSTKIYPRNF
ncbi:prepilin-type N-terminal cleavage/methylation domain-containing protein [Desulfobacula phenolica]|uniref:Prepilin-type N-terminal cleavage/methylation domain-containing protein n=1 Tax=Desulfobacula phenolica TaxID=90732 RepID=A0A1H2FSS6_9BACT|nr:prepilin-type N-terminal cleavage/methylation domain-containing protein [Desulfobacula phenolica]SDU10376.1 prepilin-type N-terminal cleavage/methylation domain-containing protein [Desulfobacula phenolica]